MAKIAGADPCNKGEIMDTHQDSSQSDADLTIDQLIFVGFNSYALALDRGSSSLPEQAAHADAEHQKAHTSTTTTHFPA
jgi:hypothetical protein